MHYPQCGGFWGWWEKSLVLLGVLAIAAYQRLISPLKGFRCAHRALYGGDSCSEHGKQILITYGVSSFIPLMKERFCACNDAWLQLQNQSHLPKDAVPSAESSDMSTDETNRYKDAQCCISSSAKNKVDAGCDAVACCWEIKQ